MWKLNLFLNFKILKLLDSNRWISNFLAWRWDTFVPKACNKCTLRMFITTLVLLFIFKLRFPVGTPVTTILFRRYGRSTLNIFRRKERISRKLEHNKCDLEFLMKCKSYNILPKFLYFKLYHKNWKFGQLQWFKD